MALKDKLENMSKQINSEKEEKKKNEEEEKLNPIRENIKRIEKEVFDLEIIKNSLDFKSDENKKNEGEGMTEYARSTASKKEKSRNDIEKIAKDNSEALERMGVKNIDDLASHPELAEEEEVVEYKKASEQESDLVLSDTKLKNRLAKLGIEISDDNFSYQTASQELTKRLEVLNNELMAEKFKTPEGKEETKEMLVKHFGKEIPQMEVGGMWENNLGNSSRTNSLSMNIGGSKREFEILNDRAKFKNEPYFSGVLPKDFSEQSEKYGVEFVNGALKKAYSSNLKEAFVKADGVINEGARGALEKLSEISPEEKSKAEMFFRDFKAKKQEALKLIDKRQEEAKEKNKGGALDFQYFRKMINFNNYYDDDQAYKNVFGNNSDRTNAFPSEYNYKGVQSSINERIKRIEDFMKVLHDFNLDEPVINDRDLSLYGFESRTLGDKFSDINSHQGSKTLRDFSNYSGAQYYFKEKIKKSEDIENKIFNKISEIVDLETTKFELAGADYNKIDIMGNLYAISVDINRKRQNISNVFSEMFRTKFSIPDDEEVEIKGPLVFFVNRKAEVDKMTEELKVKEDELKVKEEELSKKRNSEPSLFGKGKWRDEVSLMENEIVNLKNEVGNGNNSINRKKSLVSMNYVNTDDLRSTPELSKVILEYSTSGTGQEIFNDLKQKLEEMSREGLSEGVSEKYTKALRLQDKIKE